MIYKVSHLLSQQLTVNYLCPARLTVVVLPQFLSSRNVCLKVVCGCEFNVITSGCVCRILVGIAVSKDRIHVVLYLLVIVGPYQ